MSKNKKKSNKKKLRLSSILSERNIALVSLLISGLTLYLGYVAYQKLLVDKVKTEQLSLVIELVNVIQNDEILITTYPKNFGPMGTGYAEQKSNIFSISTWDEFYIDYDIYIPGNFEWLLKTDNYLYNPLLPEKIAKSLLKFRIDLEPKYDLALDSVYSINALGTPPDSTAMLIKDIEHGFLMGNRKYINGMKGFVENAKYICYELNQYFKENKIENINPLIFEKSNLLYPYRQSKFDRVKREYNYNNAQTNMYFEVNRNIRKKSDSLDNINIDSLERSEIMAKFIDKELLKIERLAD